MNCMDNSCKYLYQKCHNGEWHCLLTNDIVPDSIDKTQCENFVQARTCLDCMHSSIVIHKTDTIDDIEYRCPFQNNKLIYDDTNPYNFHYSDVPECRIGKFEEAFRGIVDFDDMEDYNGGGSYV